MTKLIQIVNTQTHRAKTLKTNCNKIQKLIVKKLCSNCDKTLTQIVTTRKLLRGWCLIQRSLMSVLLLKSFRSVPIMGCYLKWPDMAKFLLWEQYIVAVSGDVQRHCPRQFLDSGGQSQAQQDIQVQPVQYICICKSTPMPI